MSDESATDEIVYCEVCRLPHRRGVVRCEECHHLLGTAPDWPALKAELSGLLAKALAGVAALAAMLAINVLLFRGASYIVLVAPIIWTITQANRYRIVSKRVAEAGRAPAPDRETR